jgi:hypothetical protein
VAGAGETRALLSDWLGSGSQSASRLGEFSPNN